MKLSSEGIDIETVTRVTAVLFIVDDAYQVNKQPKLHRKQSGGAVRSEFVKEASIREEGCLVAH